MKCGYFGFSPAVFCDGVNKISSLCYVVGCGGLAENACVASRSVGTDVHRKSFGGCISVHRKILNFSSEKSDGNPMDIPMEI